MDHQLVCRMPHLHHISDTPWPLLTSEDSVLGWKLKLTMQMGQKESKILWEMEFGTEK